MLNTVGNERALVAALLKEPRLVFEVAPKINHECFSQDVHRALYDVICQSVMKDGLNSLDRLTMMAQAEQMEIRGFDRMTSGGEYIDALIETPVNTKSLPTIVNNIQKYYAQRKLRDHFRRAANKIDAGGSDSKGASAQEIIASIQEETMDVIHNLFGATGVDKISDGVDEFLKETVEAGGDSHVIPTCFNKWNALTGGGLRKAGLSVVAARPKSGKSTLIDQFIWDLGVTRKIPSLLLDTEMTSDFHKTLLLSRESGIPRLDIEQGTWINTDVSKRMVTAASSKLKEAPVFYKSAAGLSMPEVIVLIREFIHKYVGLNEKGYANDCVIVYDFLHLTGLKSLTGRIQEYQILGNYLTMLRTVAIQYRIPIVLVVQLNREGRDEDYGTASGTDRIEWYCSSMTILRKKLPEEVKRDGEENGKVKCRLVYSRYGEGHDVDDYTNLLVNFPIGKMSEGKNYKELAHERRAEQANDGGEEDSPKKTRKRRGRKKHGDDTDGTTN